MIEEVKEFFEDAKEGLGDKGFLIFVLGIVAFGLYNLFKNNGSDTVYYAPTGVSGYPDVGENSEVVIDSVNRTMESYYTEIMNAVQDSETTLGGTITDGLNSVENTIVGEIQTSTQNVQQNILETSTATNNYIQDGLSKWEDISAKLDNIENTPRVEYVAYYSEPVKEPTDVSNTQDTTPKPSTNVNTTNNADSSKDYFSYTTKSGLNTQQSIVDALKASGNDSSMAYREKIAEANGIQNYAGTYAQNVEMLNKLKAGTLEKPTEATKKTTVNKGGSVAVIASKTPSAKNSYVSLQ